MGGLSWYASLSLVQRIGVCIGLGFLSAVVVWICGG